MEKSFVKNFSFLKLHRYNIWCIYSEQVYKVVYAHTKTTFHIYFVLSYRRVNKCTTQLLLNVFYLIFNQLLSILLVYILLRLHFNIRVDII